MSLLFDIFQIDQLSQIREISLESNSKLDDILELQQNLYDDIQKQKAIKNLIYQYRKYFDTLKTSSRTFTDFYNLYNFIERVSISGLTSDDFDDISDKEYFDDLINDSKKYADTFINDIGLETLTKYKQGIAAMEECFILDKIVDNETKYKAYKNLDVEENKRLKKQTKGFLLTFFKSSLIGVIFIGIGLFFLLILSKLTQVKYEDYLPYVSYCFFGIGLLIPAISLFVNIPKHNAEYYIQKESLKNQIDTQLFEIVEKVYEDDLINSDYPDTYLEERCKKLHEVINKLDGNQVYEFFKNE